MKRGLAMIALGLLSLVACDKGHSRLEIAVEGSGFTSPSIGQHSYTNGTTVQVTAYSSGGASFAHWSGATSQSVNPLRLFVDHDLRLVAHFLGGGGGEGASDAGPANNCPSGGDDAGCTVVSLRSGGEAVATSLTDFY